MENLRNAIAGLLQKETQTRLLAGYRELRAVLGEKGASERAAKIILQLP